ncbi:GGDEF domain-containing protein [Sulfurimonas sp.]
MKYDFSKTIKDADTLLKDFLEMYTGCVSVEEERKQIVSTYYKKVFEMFLHPFSSKDMQNVFEEIAEYKISVEVPYIVMSNEVYGLENIIISELTNGAQNGEVVDFIKLFHEINNTIAHIYLMQYIEKLVSVNNRRRNSLSDLVEKNLIKHYEAHLIWLSALAEHIKDSSIIEFPELDDTRCKFGEWLHSEAKNIIKNNSKYKAIDQLHQNLHLFASKIFKVLHLNEYHVLISYLEKCELISLSIGTELALLDQISMNQKVAKDSLTDALNRNALESVFESQYELALATNNSFVLAMCDLDHFKEINDTYGHIAGDKVLQMFVKTVKENIRNSDLIIRYGGEEFIIILPAIQEEKGYDVLNKIREAFAQKVIKFEDKEIHSSVSIGMAEINPQKYFKKNMINQYLIEVDQELYIAKESGRNKVCR